MRVSTRLKKRLAGVEPLDFWPGLLRIQAQPPQPFARAFLYILLTLLGLLFDWAALGKLDVVASASGKLIPQSYLKIVQPSEPGVIRDILVEEGQRVQAGQVLMRMGATRSETDVATPSTAANELNTPTQANLTQIRSADYDSYTQGNVVSGAGIAAAPVRPDETSGIPSAADSNYRTLRDTDNTYVWSDGVYYGIINWASTQVKINFNNKSYLIDTDGADNFDATYYSGTTSPRGAPIFNSSLLTNFLAGGGDDIFGGSTNADNLWGGLGNDIAYGYAGDDTIYGEEGNDELQGEDGNDKLLGGIGNDKLFGQVGDDTLWGGAGNDLLNGAMFVKKQSANNAVFGEERAR